MADSAGTLLLDGEAKELVQRLSERTGEEPAKAVLTAVRERLERLSQDGDSEKSLHERLEPIVQRLKRAPVLDDRSDEDLVGYGEHGEPI